MMGYSQDFEPPETGGTFARASDPPGMLTSLRTLARAMLSLTDEGENNARNTTQAPPDRRRWGLLAQRIYSERKRRASFFPAELFGEPAWDILLDLYCAAKANELRSIKAICLASHAPDATALRYIGQLADLGLVERIDDKTDRRRKFLRLTPAGHRNMEGYLISMQPLNEPDEYLIRHLMKQG